MKTGPHKFEREESVDLSRNYMPSDRLCRHCGKLDTDKVHEDLNCCFDCGLVGTHPDDLRPYGPDGQWICFDCMTKTPERRKEAEKRLQEILDGIEGPVIIGGGLPRPVGKG